MAISKDRIIRKYDGSIEEYFEPLIKATTAEQLGKSVSELNDDDWKPYLRTMVSANSSVAKLLVDSIVSEIKNNAEFEIPPADLVGLDNVNVTVTIPVGVVSQGAGAAVVVNPIPIILSGKVISKVVSGKVKKGNIK